MTREVLLALMFVAIVVFPWQSLVQRLFRRKATNGQPSARNEFDPLATKPERPHQPQPLKQAA